VKKRIVLGLIAFIGLAGLLAACGDDDDMGGMDHGGDDSSETAEAAAEGADFNDADVTFAQGMIPHHQQAVEMADLADGRAESPEVIDLAERIKAAQDPEIEQMQGWLEDWGQEMPEAMDHEGMSGMMSEDDMTALEGASGAEFDEMFLTMMIEHHEGAIEQAETELDEGQNAEAVELAQTIIDAQQAEIEEMQGILEAA
jgi:uncharacterized protein (DUF305 family)